LIFSINISLLKVLKASNRGSQDIFQPFGLLLKGFLIFINYFSEKEGFLNRLVVLNKQCVKKY